MDSLNKFCKSDDYKYLSNIDSIYRYILLYHCNYCMQYNKGNIIRAKKIIEFFSNIIFKNVKYIQGPVSLVEYKRGDTHIYLFGDIHESKSECKKDFMNINEFINNTININVGKTLDIFLESPFISKNFYNSKSHDKNYMGRLLKMFNKCLNVDKSQCNYKNVRVHYSDIRNFLFNKYRGSILLKKDLYQRNILKKEFEKNFDILDILNKSKIDKQLKNIKDKEIKKLILLHFEDKFKDVYTNFKKFFGKQLTKENIKDYNEAHLEFTIYFMDFYLISRMFRDFNDNKVKNIIIYVGEQHAIEYDMIFEKLGFKVISETLHDKENQCIDITNFKMPFFN